ncbi:MAG: sugar transferase [Bacteroidota bacterium]
MKKLLRLKDIIVSIGLLMGLSPLFVFISLLLWVSQRKVFFTQNRPGKGERIFRLYKFSTLRELQEGEREGEHDRQRETPVGKILRRSSLDELPQLLNIFLGDMTFVGPRPLRVEYLPLYSQEERKRHLVKPGLTGWAQVHGRNQLSFKQRFKYDLWYVEHKSFWLDLFILWKTVPYLLFSRGVYTPMGSSMPKFNGTN